MESRARTDFKQNVKISDESSSRYGTTWGYINRPVNPAKTLFFSVLKEKIASPNSGVSDPVNRLLGVEQSILR